MRRLGWFAVALAVAFMIPASATGAAAAAAGATLTADPGHGLTGQSVTFTFHYSTWRCRDGLIGLWWEATEIATGRMDDSCTARLTVTPPPGATAGPHQIQAWWLATNIAAATSYVVDAPAAPTTPPPSPSPSPTVTPSTPPSPPPPSPSGSASPSGSPTPTPTRPRAPDPSPSSSGPSVAPTPSPTAPFEPAPTGPCDPGTGSAELAAGQLSGALFAEPVALHEVDPARVRPPALDLAGDPQIRLTVDTLPDPTPVKAAIAGDQPVACLHVDLPAGDGYLWASYAFRDVLLSAYESGSPTSVLSFSYGGVAWRYARPSGAVVTGDTTAPPHPTAGASIGWLVPGTGAALVAFGGGVWWWLRRTRHVGSRRA